ncbi:MAG: MBL fold metallo-hydrolase RNA specificity domain-containing protein [Nitrososphaeria archaeon]
MSSKVFLTPYGGVNRIGGNTFLIEDGSSKIFLDFGLDFGRYKSYYDFPLDLPKTTYELLITGILPKVRSHEGKQFFEYCELEKSEDRGKKWTIIEKQPIEPFSIIISHAHLDHIGNSIFLPSSTPIYLSTFSKTSFITFFLSRLFKSRGSGLIDKLAISYDSKERIKSLEKPPFDAFRNNYTLFRNNVQFKAHDILVEPYAVDHSIPGAFGFIVRTSDRVIAYTGDFRMHGLMKDFSNKFVENLSSERLDYLLCEGTNLGLNPVRSEEDVVSSTESVLKKFFEHGGEHALVILSHTNIDRISEMYGVARRLGLNLYISGEIFLLLYYILTSELKGRLRSPLPPIVKDPKIDSISQAFWPSSGEVRSLGVLVKNSPKLKELAEKLSLNVADENDFSTVPTKSLILLKDVHAILSKKFVKNSIFIASTTEHEDEEDLYDLNRFVNQVMLLGIPLLRIHSSGHASVIELIDFVKRVRPKNLIPIHTLYPNFFKSYFERILDINVILPLEGYPIRL